MYLQEDVDKYYPEAAIYEAMEVWSLPKNKTHMLEEICDKGEYFAQVKKDGNWYELCKSKTGEIYLFSRGTSVKTGLPVENISNVPHLKEGFANLPNDTVIAGEIYYPNETTNSVRSIMGCLPAKAIQRQKTKGNIHFYMHDIMRYNGTDLTGKNAWSRYNRLTEITNEHNLLNEYIEIAEIVTEDIYNFIIDTLAAGEEGVVLKNRKAVYSEGKRPAWSMIKIKKNDTVDVICMGLEDATQEYTGNGIETWEFWQDRITGELMKGQYHKQVLKNGDLLPVTKPYYYGWKTSLKIGAYKDGVLTPIGTVSSGLNDEMKKKITADPDFIIGSVVECACMEVTEDSLRHPIFIRKRTDKNPQSCTFESIFS